MRIYKFYNGIKKGEITEILNKNNIEFVIGHPTYRNELTIGNLLECDIKGIKKFFNEDQSAVIISDGTKTLDNNDLSTLKAAEETLKEIKTNTIFILVAYDGYNGNRIPGKGSALKLIFEEFYNSNTTEYLALMDGDLRNEVDKWINVYRKVIENHNIKYGKNKPLFIIAKYARHFVDASLTRFIVGPFTTLFGYYVPGGISGDIFLNKAAVKNEVETEWSENRYKYGTDISTTIENIVNNSIIYEVYLGAKLHDITDEAKLNIMPAEVIGAILDMIVKYETKNGFIKNIINNESLILKKPLKYDSLKTGIKFINPGYTDVFSYETKINTLIKKYYDLKKFIKKIYSKEFLDKIEYKLDNLHSLFNNLNNQIKVLDIDFDSWINILYKAIAYLLQTYDIETVKYSLNYFYTAAYMEFVKDKLIELGYDTIKKVMEVEKKLGVPDDFAEKFYTNNVDKKVEELAINFFNSRKKIIEML